MLNLWDIRNTKGFMILSERKFENLWIAKKRYIFFKSKI